MYDELLWELPLEELYSSESDREPESDPTYLFLLHNLYLKVRTFLGGYIPPSAFKLRRFCRRRE